MMFLWEYLILFFNYNLFAFLLPISPPATSDVGWGPCGWGLCQVGEGVVTGVRGRAPGCWLGEGWGGPGQGEGWGCASDLIQFYPAPSSPATHCPSSCELGFSFIPTTSSGHFPFFYTTEILQLFPCYFYCVLVQSYFRAVVEKLARFPSSFSSHLFCTQLQYFIFYLFYFKLNGAFCKVKFIILLVIT